ncbi:MAG TPA: hypothetical protein VFD94_03035 [Jatrophihabitans sp.]|jgi:hypothetical protein|nr:hypothetical protein [Jatrophihabitans sp.]
MRKILSLLAVAVSLLVLGLVSAGPAAALGGESLGCVVNPNPHPLTFSNPCGDPAPPNQSNQFQVTFRVLNGSGSYSYAWSVPSPWSGQIISGCTSSSIDCTFTASNTYQNITVSVTLTQGGSSETLSATAEIDPWCKVGTSWYVC